MEITNIRIILVNEKKLKAFASFILNKSFVITGLKIIEGSHGYLVSMPTIRTSDGTYRDIFYPTNSETRKIITDKVLEAFESKINKLENLEQ